MIFDMHTINNKYFNKIKKLYKKRYKILIFALKPKKEHEKTENQSCFSKNKTLLRILFYPYKY